MAGIVPFIPLILGGLSAGASVYSAIAGKPSMPDLATAKEDTSAEEAAYAEAERLRKRRGAASTIMTSPLGISTTPTTLKTQLGA